MQGDGAAVYAHSNAARYADAHGYGNSNCYADCHRYSHAFCYSYSNPAA